MVETPHHLEVLEARENLVDGCVLTGEPDSFAHTRCIAHDVETHDVCTAAVGANQRRQDPDSRRLAGAVRAEQTEDASWLDAEIRTPAPASSSGPTLRTRLSLRDRAPSLARLLEEEGCTAILAPNDYFAHQYYHWLRATGHRMPDDVSLLSFDNNHYSRPFSISSIDFGFGELAYRAAHIFLGDLPVKADYKHNLHSRPYLLARETLGQPRKSRSR